MSNIQVVEHVAQIGETALKSKALSQPGDVVKVYAFEAYDPLRDESVRAPCKMTMSDIESWRGVPIHGTGEEVAANMLDDNGRYYPDD